MLEQSVRKGTLVLNNGLWFVRTIPRKEGEKERLIPLPDDKTSLEIIVCGLKIIRFPGQLDKRARSEGAIVLYRFRRHNHGKVYKIKYWGYCPESLMTVVQIVQRANDRLDNRCQNRRLGPHRLKMAG